MCIAQKEGYNWVMSDPFIVRFNSDTIVGIDTFNNYQGLRFLLTSFTSSDESGNLLFYTNGSFIYNQFGQVMDGCDTFLAPSDYVYFLSQGGLGAGSTQGVVGFKKPQSDSLYYLFYVISDSCNNCLLYRSTIDMSQNGGLGKVIELNRVVHTESSMYPNAVSACKHANGIDWWLVIGKLEQNKNLIFLIDSNGIRPPTEYIIGDSTNYITPAGRIVFSPDGNTMAKAYGSNRTNLFDFDRCDGSLSNNRAISTFDSVPGNMDSILYSLSVAFSPNNRFLYVNSTINIFQYDLWAEDVQASETIVWSLDIDPWNSDNLILTMQLGPDGRIYVGSHSSSNDKGVTVINIPNEKGIACDVRYKGVLADVMKTDGYGIPNMPNFRLGASPVYQAAAGAHRTICKDSSTQLGSPQKVNELTYTWRSTDPNAYISDIHSHNPTVSTTLDEAMFIVELNDTVSRLTCTERSDTVIVKTYTCYPNQLNIPTIIKSGSNPYLVIPNLPAQTHVQVYNAAGQLVFESSNYQNNFNVGNIASGVYALRTRMSNGTEQRGKVVVVE